MTLEPASALIRQTRGRDPAGPARTKRLVTLKFLTQRAAALNVEGLIDRLVAHPHSLIIGKVLYQFRRDLLRRQTPVEPGNHCPTQPQISIQLGESGSLSGLIGQPVRSPRGVHPVTQVTPDLPADRRRMNPERGRDRPHRHAPPQHRGDLSPMTGIQAGTVNRLRFRAGSF